MIFLYVLVKHLDKHWVVNFASLRKKKRLEDYLEISASLISTYISDKFITFLAAEMNLKS